MFEVLLNELLPRYWLMTEKTGFTLSHGTVRAVTELLVNSENLEDKQAALAAKDVERACRLALSIDIPDSPSAVKGELEVLYQSFDRLFNALRGISHHAAFALWETARLDRADSNLADYGEDKGPGYELSRLAARANRIALAVYLTLEKMDIPRGPPPNVKGRHLAFHILVVLDQLDIRSTTYDGGTYFQILGHVFEEVFPDDSYIRHGRWALANDILEETFVNLDY